MPVVRYGRYTLVELAPASAQQDLLLQVVDVSIPDTRSATVGDALHHVLLRSGYQLCPVGDITALNSLPLPASHYRLGPMLLRDALLTLAGPAWDLKVDDGARRICFNRAQQPSSSQTQSPPQSALKAADHVERRPLTTEVRP
ncbi:PilL N-terminal domain-containing protein [Citrobacter freundii]|uniref:PFGI-1 class ICE element type IV pilus protein PilL2 n=1 Tax=Citrobacter freundii TaxID=546 RepID=UPI003CE45FBF